MEGIVIRRGEVSDEGGTVSVSGSVVLSGDLGNTRGGDGGIVKCLWDGWEVWGSRSCTAMAVAVVVELDLFLMFR